ncbi:hypothetical protein ACIOJE_39680 [Kitasatospora sp. NPDC087861]|uniref:hypothetical protein n=1 Tax=Kitasatospora sp. NPDC087861 TaxID=3364070 RepID=UPI003812D780
MTLNATSQPNSLPNRAGSGRNADFRALGLPITVRPRHTHVTGDTALLMVDWTITGPTPDGTPSTSPALPPTSPAAAPTATGATSSTTPSAPPP